MPSEFDFTHYPEVSEGYMSEKDSCDDLHAQLDDFRGEKWQETLPWETAQSYSLASVAGQLRHEAKS